ncbi:AraC family transcriptional regulator [Sphingobacterium sp. PCS056]|uniref:helix-turn-helix domain-containing protein n=1 Tax=Sphingobacterium sp. PCS056 TaxID=2931400 RepID=UPI00200C7965|nr:AraC family transcriptional regulator [Sphingobacterium sp. PCS056]UPZ34751.1 AraC family transcriptional regulator [Sphingobacterium sp. PCS056]
MNGIENKKDGFDGEVCVVVPPIVVKRNSSEKISGNFYITDIGYFPKAKFHFRQREKGCAQHILIHCVDGRGEVSIGTDFYQVHANEYILIPAHTAHTYRADYKNPWTIYWIHVNGRQASEIVNGIYKNVLIGKNVLVFGEEMKSIFEKMYTLLLKGYGREIMECISMTLPYFLSGYLHREIASNWKTETKGDIINSSILYLKTNFNTKISLKEIANNSNLSVSHFSKLFKMRTGYSPIEYLNHLKVQKACYMLQFSDSRISEISFDLGFEDQYYFSRLFKDHMGVSPSHYRNSVKVDEHIIH